MAKHKESKRKESFQHKVFAQIEILLGHYNKIVVPHPFLVLFGDLDTAVFLAQLIYWCDKGNAPDGFIYKKYREWHAETGLSEHRIKKAAKTLEGLGILEKKLKKAFGSPTIHYRLSKKNFTDSFPKLLRNKYQNIKNENLKSADSLTEPTSDITADTTTEPTKKDYEGIFSELFSEMFSKEKTSVSLSYAQFKKRNEVEEDKDEGIGYFLKKYKLHMGTNHPNLTPKQWERIIDSLFCCYDEHYEKSFDIGLEHLKAMIDKYFTVKFKAGCNYSLIHFNNSGVKIRRMFEVAY